MAKADTTVSVRIELTNYAELLRTYHSLGNLLMAMAPAADPDDTTRVHKAEAESAVLRAVIAEIDDWFNSLGGLKVPNGERIARLLDTVALSPAAHRTQEGRVDG